jgi:hypothetical protein
MDQNCGNCFVFRLSEGDLPLIACCAFSVAYVLAGNGAANNATIEVFGPTIHFAMERAVLGMRKQFQVFYAVIQRIFITVVHMFAAGKGTLQVLCHYVAMFEYPAFSTRACFNFPINQCRSGAMQLDSTDFTTIRCPERQSFPSSTPVLVAMSGDKNRIAFYLTFAATTFTQPYWSESFTAATAQVWQSCSLAFSHVLNIPPKSEKSIAYGI